ncbi:NF-kappa-B inhibitor-interacting Ras-like protein 2 [Armadillidium nasatum]|uniref:NF-kappa-B inhibitor-interacting Ras-like protein 2 n=1 Tax=Armadillidium nasatum TaxID=96803 RepID=A0A5N5TLS4_9CRUS|nr:NF-kappa-B inhibitor-interacting Ras-like protein 2 [Armadillidium nasatum]
MRFYDTAGMDVRNRTIPAHYHTVADAYILVYSLTDRLSFQLLVDIKKDIEKNKEKKDVPCIVIGNKLDLVKDRVVDAEMSESWVAAERLKYWETSIFDRQSLIEPLVFLSSKLAPQPNKTTFPQLSISRKNKE